MPSNTASSLDRVGRAVFTPMAKTYYEKLKDPRWQKKRLEVMQRDCFACRQCGDKTSTLNVHHMLYRKNAEPWDYDPDLLITLCEACHATSEAKWQTLKSCQSAYSQEDWLMVFVHILATFDSGETELMADPLSAFAAFMHEYTPIPSPDERQTIAATMRHQLKLMTDGFEKVIREVEGTL